MPRVRMIAFLLILGGVVFGDGIVTINNSTISSNIAGGFFNRTSGGGIYIGGGTATVSNSTLSGKEQARSAPAAVSPTTAR